MMIGGWNTTLKLYNVSVQVPKNDWLSEATGGKGNPVCGSHDRGTMIARCHDDSPMKPRADILSFPVKFIFIIFAFYDRYQSFQ